VGVIGGMGPDATVDFMAKVIGLTPAAKDQDHVRMIVDHNPRLPNRKLAIIGNGEDPGPILAAMASGLEKAGAEVLVMPCNTAHAFAGPISEAVSISLVSIIDVTVAACEDYGVVGILATDSCLRCNLYQDALAAKGIDAVQPDSEQLAEFMRLITLIKAGDRSESVVGELRHIAESQVASGAQAIVAGCTEVPLVLSDSMLDVPLISSTDELAKATVRIAFDRPGS
jgi:aspartate racemase